MEKKEDKDRTLGQLVIDFANADTREKASKLMERRFRRLFRKRNITQIIIDDSFEETKGDLRNLLDEI